MRPRDCDHDLIEVILADAQIPNLVGLLKSDAVKSALEEGSAP